MVGILNLDSCIIESIIQLYYSSSRFDLIANSLYELTKFDKDGIPFSTMLLKIILIYLIVQFVVTFKQNTRRK